MWNIFDVTTTNYVISWYYLNEEEEEVGKGLFLEFLY